MITGKIDVTKIDKARLFKGKKGTYLDVVLIETPESEYGDYMIVQEIPKDERKAGVKGNILGNAKRFERGGQSEPAPTAKQQQPKPKEEADDNVPF